MPTYDYQCLTCNKDFTALHKISEAPPPCPDCGGEVKKRLSAPAVHGTAQKAAPFRAGPGCGMEGCGHRH
jgi:putative FmdB family regulatory protein